MLTDSDCKFITIGNLRIRYIDKNVRGRALLLVHGLGGSLESWTNNIQYLSSKFRVIALDLPGFGLSDKPRIDYTINFYVSFLRKFVKKLNLASLGLIGSSLGGHIAVEFTLKNMKLVQKMILVSPAGSPPKSFRGTSVSKRYFGIIRAESSNEVKKILSSIDNCTIENTHAEIVFRQLSLPGARHAFNSALKGSAMAPRYDTKLDKIDSPMLLLWGKDDRMIPIRFIHPFLENGNSRIVIFENCGHRPHVEKPKLFNKIVKDFLNE